MDSVKADLKAKDRKKNSRRSRKAALGTSQAAAETTAIMTSKATPYLAKDVEPLLRPFSLRAMFMRAVYLEKSAWLEHIPFAFWLVAAHQPKVFVELGAHYGTSYFAFCQAVERLGLDTRCFAVDTWKGDEHAGFYGKEVFEQVRTHNDALYSDFSRLIRSTFDEAVGYFSDGTVDLLHIDGLHTLEAVRHDFETWLPKLSNRGLVLFHDCNVRERHFGVFKLVEELRKHYPCFEFTHGHGLAVVAVGKDQSELVSRLLDADTDELERRSLHEIFGRLGRACADSYAVQAEQARARDLETHVAKYKEETEKVRVALEKVQSELDLRGRELSDLRSASKNEAERRVLENNLLGERATLLQAGRDDLRSEVIRLNAKLEADSAELKQLTESVFRLQNAVRESEKELYEARRAHDQDKFSLHSVRTELERARELFESTRSELENERRSNRILTERLEATVAALEAERENSAALQEALSTETAARAECEKNESNLRKETTNTLAEMQSERDAARVAMHRSTQTIDQLRSEVVELSRRGKEIQAERDEQISAIAVSEKKLARLDFELASALATQQANVKIAEEMRERADRLVEQVKDLNKERENLIAALASLAKERDQVVLDLENSRRQSARLEEAGRAKQIEVDREAAGRTAIRAELDRAKAEVNDLCVELSDRFDETAKLTELYLSEREQAKNLRLLLDKTEGKLLEISRSINFGDAQRTESLNQFRSCAALLLGKAIYTAAGYSSESPPSGSAFQSLVQRMERSELLDSKWYLERYQDVAQAGIDAATHYLTWGVFEGREPISIATFVDNHRTPDN